VLKYCFFVILTSTEFCDNIFGLDKDKFIKIRLLKKIFLLQEKHSPF